jgi:hypothetical protein
MMITKKSISRRTVLRGLGTAIALPVLDAMIPALTPLARVAAAQPIRRFLAVYVPMGFNMEMFTPATDGPLELSPILEPLEAFKDRLLVVSGLNNDGAGLESDGGNHPRLGTAWLTGARPRQTEGPDAAAGISMDQVAARELGVETQLPSLELALESVDSLNGNCSILGYGCVYSNTISWHTATAPLPMEMNPRAVFERLFGDSGTTDRGMRLARMRTDRSYLDAVTDKIGSLRARLDARDGSKLSEYLDSVRDVERRIQKAEEQVDRELLVVEQPRGVPALFEDHAKLMYDLLTLAYQSDLTRVATLLASREGSVRTFPEIGVRDPWHPLSHHGYKPENLANQAKINTWQLSIFGYLLERLQETSLLDTTTILYGSGMSNSEIHSPLSVPVLVAGGEIKGGRHIRCAPNTPLSNLELTLLQKLGVPAEQFGDSTGTLAEV